MLGIKKGGGSLKHILVQNRFRRTISPFANRSTISLGPMQFGIWYFSPGIRTLDSACNLNRIHFALIPKRNWSCQDIST